MSSLVSASSKWASSFSRTCATNSSREQPACSAIRRARRHRSGFSLMLVFGNTSPPRGSSELALDERDLENLFVVNRTVPEVALLTEQLAMIGSDRDVRVLRGEIEQLLDHAVQVSDGFDLPAAELGQLAVVEHLGPAAPQAPAHDRLIQVLEDAVHAADARPLILGLIR